MSKIVPIGFSGLTGTARHFSSFCDSLMRFQPLGQLVVPFDFARAGAPDHVSLNAQDIAIFFKPYPQLGTAYTIKWGIFETENLPARYIAWLRDSEEVWVPTQWAFHVLSREMPSNKIAVIREGVDPHEFHPFGRVAREEPGIKFLNIGSLQPRKGIEELVTAFNNAIDRVPDIHLSLKLDNFLKQGLGNSEAKQFLTNIGAHKNIQLVSGGLTDQSLFYLYRSHNAYVTATRGEGWGLPVIESLACGLELVSPNHTGLTEFLQPLNDQFYEVKSSQVTFSPSPLYGRWLGQNEVHCDIWEKVDVSVLTEQIIQCALDIRNNRSSDNAARSSIIRTQFAWQVSAEAAWRQLLSGPLSTLSISAH